MTPCFSSVQVARRSCGAVPVTVTGVGWEADLAAPWERQPVIAGAGSGHLEASLYLPCCVFWLGFAAAPLGCVPGISVTALTFCTLHSLILAFKESRALGYTVSSELLLPLVAGD